MPNSIGIPTNEEVSHYSRVISKSQDVIDIMKVKPLDRTAFDIANGDLKKMYSSFNNPNISTGSPMNDFPHILEQVANVG